MTTTVNTKANTAAVITAEDVTILIDSTFNPLKGVTIYDAEDGNVTVTSAHIKSNNVNVAKRGTYTVTYVYVDKGGLTTTLNRTVKVSNELEAPENLTVKLNQYGLIEMSWDAVDNAYTYDIFVGSYTKEIDYTKKTTFVLDPEDYDGTLKTEIEKIYKDLRDGKNLKVGVSAVHKYEDEVKDSSITKETFYSDELIDELAEIEKDGEFEISKTPVEALLKLSPVGINSKKAVVEVTFWRDGKRVANEFITDSIRTDKMGEAEFDYDVENGIEFELTFDEVADYELVVVIKDDNYTLHSETYKFETYRKGASTKRGYTKPQLISWTGDDIWGSNSGAELVFSLSEDFDIEETEHTYIKMTVYADSKEYTDKDWIYYDKDNNEYYETFGGNTATLEYENEEILGSDFVEADEEIVMYFNSSTKGLRQITQDYKDGCKIYIYVEIEVTDFENTTKSLKTKTLTFQKD